MKKLDRSIIRPIKRGVSLPEISGIDDDDPHDILEAQLRGDA
jgi:hypothetical protein